MATGNKLGYGNDFRDSTAKTDAAHNHQVAEFGEQNTHQNSPVNILILGCEKSDSVLIFLNALFNFLTRDFTNDPMSVIKYELNPHGYHQFQFVKKNENESCQEYCLNVPSLYNEIRFIVSHGNESLRDAKELFYFFESTRYQLNHIFIVFKTYSTQPLLALLSLLHHDVFEIITFICYEAYDYMEPQLLSKILQKKEFKLHPQTVMTFNSITYTNWVLAHNRKEYLTRFRNEWQTDSFKWKGFFEGHIIRQIRPKTLYETQALVKASVFQEQMIFEMFRIVKYIVELEKWNLKLEPSLQPKKDENHGQKVMQHKVGQESLNILDNFNTLEQKIEYLLSNVLRIEFHIRNNCIQPDEKTFNQRLDETIMSGYQLNDTPQIRLRAKALLKKCESIEEIKIPFNSVEDVMNTIKECEFNALTLIRQ